MSLEDLNLDFQADESDDEAERSSNESEDDDEVDYIDLVLLHHNLKFFQHIYSNNAIIDMELQMENNEDGGGLDSDSTTSELALLHDYVESIFEDLSSSQASQQSSVASHEDVPSCDGEDSASVSLQSLIDLLEEATSTSSSTSSSDSLGPDGEHLQDEVEESWP